MEHLDFLAPLCGRRWLYHGAPAPHGRDPFCLESPNGLRPLVLVRSDSREDAPEPYGACLRDLRKAIGRTQAELAEVACLCPNTIGHLETQRDWHPWRSTHECVMRALRAVGVSEHDLLRLEQAYWAARRAAF